MFGHDTYAAMMPSKTNLVVLVVLALRFQIFGIAGAVQS